MKNQIRILLIKEGEWWIAQGLELNISVQVRFLKDLQLQFIEAVQASIDAYEETGLDWKQELLNATPKKYHDMYAKAIPIGYHIDNQLEKLLGSDCVNEETRMYEVEEQQELVAC